MLLFRIFSIFLQGVTLKPWQENRKPKTNRLIKTDGKRITILIIIKLAV